MTMKRIYPILVYVFFIVSATLLIMGLVLTDGESSKLCYNISFSSALVALTCSALECYYKVVDRIKKLEELIDKK